MVARGGPAQKKKVENKPVKQTGPGGKQEHQSAKKVWWSLEGIALGFGEHPLICLNMCHEERGGAARGNSSQES